MLFAVAAVALLAFWDERRESAEALDDFAEEQAALAGSVASELATRLAAARRDGLLIAESLNEGRNAPATALDGYTSYALRPAGAALPEHREAGVDLRIPASGGRTLDLVLPPIKLLEGAARVERPGMARLFLRGPDDLHLRSTDGALLDSVLVQSALAASDTSVWLDRTEAAALGLPLRRAAAGFARIDAGPLGHWAVAVVTSAEHVRDRELRAVWRLTLSVFLAAGLVFVSAPPPCSGSAAVCSSSVSSPSLR